MTQSGVYSESKMTWWYAREQKLPEAPKQVQLILSDLCNQDCSFCHPAGTIIHAPAGDKKVEDVQVGDRITGPDGEAHRVTSVGHRIDNQFTIIGTQGRYLTVTSEHPVLTLRGWIDACLVTESDWVFVEADNHYCWGIAPVKVESIIGERKERTVYSIEIEDIHSYIADGFVVHNCAYRMSGYTSNELFIGDSEPAKYGHSNPKRFIPRDRALSLLTEMQDAGVLAIQFTGGGEPTVHPDCDEIFRAALQLGFHCALVSNGVKWSRPLMRDILPQFDWVRVSIDAGHAGSYAKIRNTPIGNFDRVWGNVTTTAERIGAAGTPCVLGVGFVVTPTSYPEILEFAHAAKYSGAQNARFSALFSQDDDKPFRECYELIQVELDCAKKLSSDTFHVYDNFGNRFADLKQRAPDYQTCAYQYYTTYIGGDLNVYRCCVYAYNKRGLVNGGNLRERSFSEFWASQERKDDMAALDARGCERCQFNTKNREMLYVMGDTASDTVPRHLEWP